MESWTIENAKQGNHALVSRTRFARVIVDLYTM